MLARYTLLAQHSAVSNPSGKRAFSFSASQRATQAKSTPKGSKSTPTSKVTKNQEPLPLSALLRQKLNRSDAPAVSTSASQASKSSKRSVKDVKEEVVVPSKAPGKPTHKAVAEKKASPVVAAKDTNKSTTRVTKNDASVATKASAKASAKTAAVTTSEKKASPVAIAKAKAPTSTDRKSSGKEISSEKSKPASAQAKKSPSKAKTAQKSKAQQAVPTRVSGNPKIMREVVAPVDPDTLPRGAQRQKLLISVGDIIHGFRVTEKQHVPERNMTAYLLSHEATGARHLHLECDDMENMFCTTFKTIPTNSKGIPHILEHLALCGSSSYPVRDPFFNMAKRSLATYMNAWTGPDFTSYPFSSQNVKDYYNLLAVYLDAMYFPKLEYLDFLQEGIRVEMTTPEEEAQDTMEAEEHAVEEDETIEVAPVETKTQAKPQKKEKQPKGPMKPKFKGVVFNEMKGALSDPNDLFVRLMQSKVFPTTTYHHNSGGDPQDITNLTHQELLRFHDTFYHPSNSFSMTYGDLPLAPHLQFMNERALNKFTRRESQIRVPDEQRYDKPIKVHVHGPLSSLGDPDKQNKVAVSWLTNNITEQFETSCMSLISSLLLHGPNAPMYQALITSQLGSGYSAGSGYDSSYREAVFQIGLTNVDYKDLDTVERTILATLNEAAETGFPQERIDSLLHQLELGQRNVSTGFGITLLQGLTHVWMHGGSPIAALQFNDFLDRLKRELAADPRFFQKKIQEHLLKNKHRVTLIMLANEDYLEDQARREKKKIKALTHKLKTGQAPQTVEEIKAQTKKLKRRQATPDDVKILPKLSLGEIDVKLPKVDIIKENIHQSIPVHWIPQPTNGISYFYGKMTLDGLPEHLVPYVPLFCSTLTQMGAGDMDFKQLAQEIEGTTGMLRSYYSIVDSPTELGKFTPYVFFRSSALERNIPKMFDLWNTVLQKPRFTDTQRLKTILGLIRSRMHDSLVDSGSSYAALTAASQISPLHRLKESWAGLSQYNLIRSLSTSENLDDTVAKLQEIAEFLLQRERLQVAVNAEQALFPLIEKSSSGFIDALKSGSIISSASSWSAPLPTASPKPTYLSLPIQVNYVADVYRGAAYTDPDYSKLDMMTSLLSHNYLHKEVREKGGAYGSGLSHNDGVLSFYSYRDPSVKQTLQTFLSSRDWLMRPTITEQQFDDAKLSLFGSLDSPVAPSSKGLSEFKHGLTYEMRQERRQRLMDVKLQDVAAMAEKYLGSDKDHAVAVFGSATLGKEFENDPSWVHRHE